MPESQQRCHARARDRVAEPDLGHSGGVRVVQDRDVGDAAAEPLGEQRARVRADPGLVDIGRGVRDALLHHRRERHPDRAVPARLRDDFGDDVRHRLRGRRLRGVDPDPVARQLPGLEVDQCALDPAAADVNAETSGRLYHGRGPFSHDSEACLGDFNRMW